MDKKIVLRVLLSFIIATNSGCALYPVAAIAGGAASAGYGWSKSSKMKSCNEKYPDDDQKRSTCQQDILLTGKDSTSAENEYEF